MQIQFYVVLDRFDHDDHHVVDSNNIQINLVGSSPATAVERNLVELSRQARP